MHKKGYLIILGVIIVAFWQLVFLQNGMKWDFVDAFLPARYFFSESILNNQFPLWNPYLLYGTPIYADLGSVFNPEFWIVGNMFGYTNITLQFMYLVYIFIAGISFQYFLKQFKTEQNIAIGLSIAYMLSGFSIGNAQHLSFVFGYAIIPFVLASYIQFVRQVNWFGLIRLALALIFMIYASYPGLTIILLYLLLTIFIYFLIINWSTKACLKRIFLYHLYLGVIVVLASSVLFVAYYQAVPFLSRYSGLSVDQALKHSFTFQSFLSFLFPMSTGNANKFFETDTSMSNGYFGAISLVLFLFSLTKKVKFNETYLFLFFGVLSLGASLGNQFFVRELLYDYAPLMDLFKYPSIFRAFTIFCFLAFVGTNYSATSLVKTKRNSLVIISFVTVVLILIVIWWANLSIDKFVFFTSDKSFSEEILNSTLYDNIILQGIFQILLMLGFITVLWKIRKTHLLSFAVMCLFILDGIVATQLNTHYTVISDSNPVEFRKYLRSSPKGFPIPELNPIGVNSDKNAGNEFTWMNNNVFPKKVTYDGLVSFKLDGYTYLADHYPELLESIKEEAIVYLSDDVKRNAKVEDYKSNTIFLSESDYRIIEEEKLLLNERDNFKISNFSPNEIGIDVNVKYAQLLVYQQNYYAGWKVFVDGVEQKLLKSNFAHMAVLVPSGKHTIRFEFINPIIKFTFGFVAILLLVLIVVLLYFYVEKYPQRRNSIIRIVIGSLVLFIVCTSINRVLYQKNKLGLTEVINDNIVDWRLKYNDEINIFLSSYEANTEIREYLDTICYVDEKTNKDELSHFLTKSTSNYFAFGWKGCIISGDILELILSFYPKTIEIKRNHNSGIILFSKNGENSNYSFFENFELQNQSGWSVDKNRVVKDSVTGNKFYSYGINEEWGTILEIPINGEFLSVEKISVIADFMIEDRIVDIPLIFSVERNGELFRYETILTNKFAKYPNKWSRAVFVSDLNRELQEGDLVKIYFWNNSKGRFFIDNLKLRISSSPKN